MNQSLINVVGYRIEIIFINDGSDDQTLSRLNEIRDNDSRVRYLNFSRNFGHQASIWAGMMHSNGACVITIDADLQDPPELIPEMLRRWEQGAEVVATRRINRESDNRLKRVTAAIFYRLIARFTDDDRSRQIGDYRLISRNVLDQVLKIPSGSAYIRGLVGWVGFRQEVLDFTREIRIAGESKYTFRKMMSLALSGIVSSSTRPLLVAFQMASTVSFFAVAYAIVLLTRKILDPTSGIPGYSSLILVTLVLGAMQLFAVGLLGIYLAQSVQHSHGRPPFLLSSTTPSKNSNV